MNNFNFGDKKTRYKLYKSKKRWLVAGITLFSFGLGVTGLQSAASANSNSVSETSSIIKGDANEANSSADNKGTILKENSAVSTNTETQSSSFSNSTSSTSNKTTAKDSGAASNKATVKNSSAASSNAVSNKTTVKNSSAANSSVASNKATVKDSSAESSTANTKASNATNSTTTKGVSSAAVIKNDIASVKGQTKTEIKNSVGNSDKAGKQATSLKTDKNNTHEISYQDILNQLAKSGQATDAFTHVTAANFLDYFSLNGSAVYDASTGIVTLTDESKYDEVGNFSLNSKIDMGQSFTLTGQINAGNKTNGQGADGISFGFHNGNTTDIGQSGGNLGIGGLQDAIGWKLDTWWNVEGTPTGAKNGDQIGNNSREFGWSKDPGEGGNDSIPFGAFVSTSDKQVKATDGNYYQRWWAETDASSSQLIDDSNIDGQFHDFVVQYNGSSRELTISYTTSDGEVMTWSKEVDSASKAMAMIVSASTGSITNVQQFKINNFDFYQAATVNVTYVDQQGNVLTKGEPSYPNGSYVNRSYLTSAAAISGYNFVKMDDGSVTGQVSLPANGTLSDAGDNGTVIYVYAPAYTAETNVVNETVNYLDKQTGDVVADVRVSTPVTFVTVTNPVDGSKTTYYSTTETEANLDKETGIPTGDWTKGDSTSFAEVVSPDLSAKGYTAPDQASIAKQDVNSDTKDLTFNVYYDHQTVPVGPDDPNWPAGSTEENLKDTITRTITYVDAESDAEVSKQVTEDVTYKRTAIVDLVTKETLGYDTNGDGKVDTTDATTVWVAEDGSIWSEVVSPDLTSEGYGDPSMAKVAEVTVDSDDGDSVVNIYYKHATPDTPGTPATPDTPGTPGTPATPDTPDTPGTPATPDTPGTPATPESSQPTEAVDNPATNVTPAQKQNTATNNSDKNTLPQTGEEDSNAKVAIGALGLLASIMGLFGLGKRRRNEKD